MKSRTFKVFMAVVMLSILYMGIATGTQNEMLAGSVTVSMGAFSAIMYVSKMMKSGYTLEVITIPDFTEKTTEEKEKLSFEELETYLKDKRRFDSATQKKDISDMIVKALEENADSETLKLLKTQMDTLIEENNGFLLKLKEATEKDTKLVPVGIMEKLLEKKDDLIKIMGGAEIPLTFEFDLATVKAGVQQNPSDIGNRTDYAQFLPGIDEIPRRKTYIKNRIRTSPVRKEYIKYTDQETVVRDAKNVAQCATSTHTTKLTWTTRNMQITKTRDLIDVCIDMLDDYDWTEGQIRDLVTSSLQLKVDNDLLLSDAIYPNPNSIDAYSSTFNAANPAADYALKIQTATIIDLIVISGAQIMAFGQENFFMADTVYMNPTDYTLMTLLKDGEDNYIKSGTVDPRIFQDRGGNVWINGNILVIPNPNVPEGEFYIFDSTKATIFQRKTAEIKFSFENKTNFEDDVVTIKATERYNLLVKNNQMNAFMHIPDIAAAVIAITKL